MKSLIFAMIMALGIPSVAFTPPEGLTNCPDTDHNGLCDPYVETWPDIEDEKPPMEQEPEFPQKPNPPSEFEPEVCSRAWDPFTDVFAIDAWQETVLDCVVPIACSAYNTVQLQDLREYAFFASCARQILNPAHFEDFTETGNWDYVKTFPALRVCFLSGGGFSASCEQDVTRAWFFEDIKNEVIQAIDVQQDKISVHQHQN